MDVYSTLVTYHEDCIHNAPAIKWLSLIDFLYLWWFFAPFLKKWTQLPLCGSQPQHCIRASGSCIITSSARRYPRFSPVNRIWPPHRMHFSGSTFSNRWYTLLRLICIAVFLSVSVMTYTTFSSNRRFTGLRNPLSTPRCLTVLGMRTISWTALSFQPALLAVHFGADCTRR